MRVACTCSLQWVAAVNKLSHGVCVCGGGGGGLHVQVQCARKFCDDLCLFRTVLLINASLKLYCTHHIMIAFNVAREFGVNWSNDCNFFCSF